MFFHLLMESMNNL